MPTSIPGSSYAPALIAMVFMGAGIEDERIAPSLSAPSITSVDLMRHRRRARWMGRHLGRVRRSAAGLGAAPVATTASRYSMRRGSSSASSKTWGPARRFIPPTSRTATLLTWQFGGAASPATWVFDSDAASPSGGATTSRAHMGPRVAQEGPCTTPTWPPASFADSNRSTARWRGGPCRGVASDASPR